MQLKPLLKVLKIEKLYKQGFFFLFVLLKEKKIMLIILLSPSLLEYLGKQLKFVTFKKKYFTESIIWSIETKIYLIFNIHDINA